MDDLLMSYESFRKSWGKRTTHYRHLCITI
jgi:hypothetical protein